MKGEGDCLVEGVTVTATINRIGSRLIDVSPDSQETDASGQAVFSINAKKKGRATIAFGTVSRGMGMAVRMTVRVK